MTVVYRHLVTGQRRVVMEALCHVSPSLSLLSGGGVSGGGGGVCVGGE